MAITQTYESHLIGVGLPLTGAKLSGVVLFDDEARYLPLAQGFAYSYGKDIKRESYITKNGYSFNRQVNWPDVDVNIRQIDYHITGEGDGWSGYSGIFGDLNIFPRGSFPSSGTFYPIVKHLVTGGRNADGGAIYFLSDTGQKYRDQIYVPLTDTGYYRQIAVIDPCYVSSIRWSVASNTPALYDFGFVGNYIEVISQQKGDGFFYWDKRNPFSGGAIDVSGKVQIGAAHWGGNYLNLQNVDGIFIGPKISVSRAPDFGEIRGISWELPLTRTNILGLGSPMVYDRKVEPCGVGSLSIEYNFEGQEISEVTINDALYEIHIICQNDLGITKTYKIENAQIENAGLTSSTQGEPDSYSLQFSFPFDKDGGILEKWET